MDQSLFARNFGSTLQRHVEFLDYCRPLAVTIRNTYQFIKQALNQLDSISDWEEVSVHPLLLTSHKTLFSIVMCRVGERPDTIMFRPLYKYIRRTEEQLQLNQKP